MITSETLVEVPSGAHAPAAGRRTGPEAFAEEGPAGRVQLYYRRFGRDSAGGQRPVFVSVDGADSAPLVARLERAGVALEAVLQWGRESTCAALVERRPSLIVLDTPAGAGGRLATLVRAASLVAPVAVVCPGGGDAVAAFNAGALDVLDRDAPAVELAWRIFADLRRCPAPAEPGGPVGRTASQRLLFEVLSNARTPVCCHHLRTLMATPANPLTLPALKARIQRLVPALEERGLDLVVDQQWGLATYQVRPV